MALNLYLAAFTFFMGLGFGYTFFWLWNNKHRKIVISALIIIVGYLLVDGIRSVFNPDTPLRHTYSEVQGWVDFLFGFAGWMFGCYLEDRHERNRKFKIIVKIPRQAPVDPHTETPKVFGMIKIVPERYKEREDEQYVMGGLPKYVMDGFFRMPRSEQARLVNSTVKAVGEFRLFQLKMKNVTSLPELVDELKGLTDTAVKYIKTKGDGGFEERFQMWLSNAKLSLIEIKLQELSKMPRNRMG